ncbi:MAG: thioesterase family protein [Thermoleophilaceae bacterium]
MSRAGEAFYLPDGDAYRATESTRGPWDPGSQHAGPPCALLGRELDRAGELQSGRLARATFEILRPVPIASLTVRAEVARGGRSVELVEGVMEHEGQPVLRARGWRVRTEALDLDAHTPEPPDVPGPEAGQDTGFFPTGQEVGYHTAMEVRFVYGSFTEPGPALAWMRMRVALVEGEEPEPLHRVLAAADSGNGVSSPLDYRRWMFINADVSVSLRRHPRGEWVGLQAATYAEPDGIGMSDTMLRDEDGMIGRATQSLFVAPQKPG